MTLGLSVIIRQLRATPPIGVIALSISAVVVPGAKFLAMTTYGPASPLIEIPDDGFLALTMLTWSATAEDESEPFRAE
jgi:hypothetical protein